MQKRAPHTHRELELLDVLRRLGGTARNTELARALDVSEETVRRTIKSLSKSGALERVHGGAYLAGTQSDPSFFRRILQHADEKRVIAARVVEMVGDGMTLFLDAGSTTAFVAEELRKRSNLVVVTNSIGVAQTLSGAPGNRVYLLGGELQMDERGCFGHVAHRQAQRYVFDLAVLGTDAISASKGFLFSNAAEAELASVIAEHADRVLVVAAHFKFGGSAPYRGFEPQQAHGLVTDRKPKGAVAAALKAWGVKVHVAAEADANVVTD